MQDKIERCMNNLSIPFENLDPDMRNVVILDGVGWHISKTLKIPENVTLINLPLLFA